MAQNYEVFVADRPLMICREIVDNPRVGELPCLPLASPEQVLIVRDAIRSGSYPQGVVVQYADTEEVWRIFAANHKVLLAAGGLVRNAAQELLAIKRLGLWDLPKGKLEKGESFAFAALREVEEECGIACVLVSDSPLFVTHHTYIHKGREVLKRTDWFAMRPIGEHDLVPQEEEDITEVLWMTERQVKEVFLKDTYRSIAQVLLAEPTYPTP